MVANDIITRARQVLQDEDSTAYRWTATALLGYVSDAVQDALLWRTDLQLNDAGALGTFGIISASGDSIAFPDHLMAPLADYVASRALSEDGADKANAAKAKECYARYLLALKGGG